MSYVIIIKSKCAKRRHKMENINQKIGLLLKKVRINENKSQNSFINNDLSRSKLSRIESGKTNLSVSELITFLDKLTITEEEFFQMLLPEDSEKNHIKEKSLRLGMDRELLRDEILSFIIELEKKFSDTGDLYYFYHLFYNKNLLGLVKSNDLQFVINYLTSKKMYTYFDYALLSNSIMYLNHFEVKKIVDLMLPELSKLPETNKLQGKINLMFINLLNRGIMTFHENETYEYLKHALKHNEQFPDYFTKVQLLYLSNLADFRFKKDTQCLENCFDYIDIMEKTGLHELAKESRSEIQLYIKYPHSLIPQHECKMVHSFYN